MLNQDATWNWNTIKYPLLWCDMQTLDGLTSGPQLQTRCSQPAGGAVSALTPPLPKRSAPSSNSTSCKDTP
jgi:hypothetical protein